MRPTARREDARQITSLNTESTIRFRGPKTVMCSICLINPLKTSNGSLFTKALVKISRQGSVHSILYGVCSHGHCKHQSGDWKTHQVF